MHYLCNGEIGIIKKKHSQIELLDISYSRLVDVDITTRCLLVQSVDLLQLLIGQSFLNLIRQTFLSFSVPSLPTLFFMVSAAVSKSCCDIAGAYSLQLPRRMLDVRLECQHSTTLLIQLAAPRVYWTFSG